MWESQIFFQGHKGNVEERKRGTPKKFFKKKNSTVNLRNYSLQKENRHLSKTLKIFLYVLFV